MARLERVTQLKNAKGPENCAEPFFVQLCFMPTWVARIRGP